MDEYVIGDSIAIEVPIFDDNGVAITNAANLISTTIKHTAPDGTRTPIAPTGFVYDGGGIYLAHISNALEGRYSGTIVYSGPPAQPFSWSAKVITSSQNDPVAALGDSTIEILSPVSPDGGMIALIQGDSYEAARSRAISIQLNNQADLTNFAVTLTIRKGIRLAKPMEVFNPNSGSPTVVCELTIEETASLSPYGEGDFDISAQLLSTNETLARGIVTVERDV